MVGEAVGGGYPLWLGEQGQGGLKIPEQALASRKLDTGQGHILAWEVSGHLDGAPAGRHRSAPQQATGRISRAAPPFFFLLVRPGPPCPNTLSTEQPWKTPCCGRPLLSLSLAVLSPPWEWLETQR